MAQPGRLRKACDLCYRKKIKCDAQRPRCTHCVGYDSACTFETASRKSRAKKQRSNNEGFEALQSRMKQLEENLSQALQEIDELKGHVPQGTTATSLDRQALVANLQEEGDVNFLNQRLYDGSLDLPPLQETLPAVEKYLATLNTALPLFHPDRLLHSLKSWYETPLVQRDCVTWAAINVVLALAHRQVPPDQAMLPNKNTAHYLYKAQSVLTEVVMGKTNLVNIQILLGMVMLFQGTRNLKPATMLIAVALRLAHELGLHARRGSESPDPSTALERDRVFWIAYLLDRDISMRTGQPPVQLETDIDLEFPSDEPEDGAGLVFTADSSSSLNFFRARVQLARIQGKVYELMLSMPAKNLDAYKRGENMALLHYILDEWASQIPPQFQVNAILGTCEPSLFRNLGILYATHLSCRTQVCRAHIMETQWLESLQDFGKKPMQQRIIEPVLLPQGWQGFVNESREYMKLFMGVERKDPAFVWMTACTYLSGSICLITNNMLHPRHDSLEQDQYLSDLALLFLEDMIQQEPWEPLQKTRNAYKEMQQYAYNICLQNALLQY